MQPGFKWAGLGRDLIPGCQETKRRTQPAKRGDKPLGQVELFDFLILSHYFWWLPHADLRCDDWSLDCYLIARLNHGRSILSCFLNYARYSCDPIAYLG